MKIRRARPADAPTLTTLILASKQSNGYDDAFMAACADELSVTAQDIIDQILWVAEDSEITGCVCLKVEDDIGTINTFFVHPDHKRKGIGHALWQQVQNIASQKNLTLLKLDADPAAVPFYETIGFKTIHEVPSGSIPGRMLPHMQLVL